MTEPGSQAHTEPSSHDRVFYLILGVALILRTFHLAYPPWDSHSWQQTQTLNLARDFARRSFHILYPQVQWVCRERPQDASYYSGEFSVESILAAGLYKVFGEGDVLARVAVLAFSPLGIFFLFRLALRQETLKRFEAMSSPPS